MEPAVHDPMPDDAELEQPPVVRYIGTADVRELTGPGGWPLAWSQSNGMAVTLAEFKAAFGDTWRQVLADSSTEFVPDPEIADLVGSASVEFQIGG